jgi:hypothetical protein
MLFKLSHPARDGERFNLSNKGESVCIEYFSLQFCYESWDDGTVGT